MTASVGAWTRPSETTPPPTDRRRAGGGHADEPVGLGPRAGRGLERLQLIAGAQLVEPLSNRLLRHRADPQAVDGLRCFRGGGRRAEDRLVEVREDQLTLAAGV